MNIEERKQQLARFELQDRWNEICPPLYRGTDEARLTKRFLDRVLKWECGPRGLVLVGPTGTGKTRCMYTLLKRLLYGKFREPRLNASGATIKDIMVLTSNQFGHDCLERFGNHTVIPWLRKLCNVKVLAIDDFGKETLTERVEAELFNIVEMRIANNLPLIITTNFDGKRLLSKFSADRGEPLLRRLREFCDQVIFINN